MEWFVLGAGGVIVSQVVAGYVVEIGVEFLYRVSFPSPCLCPHLPRLFFGFVEVSVSSGCSSGEPFFLFLFFLRWCWWLGYCCNCFSCFCWCCHFCCCFCYCGTCCWWFDRFFPLYGLPGSTPLLCWDGLGFRICAFVRLVDCCCSVGPRTPPKRQRQKRLIQIRHLKGFRRLSISGILNKKRRRLKASTVVFVVVDLVLVVFLLCGMQNTPSLPLLPGPLQLGVEAPDRALSMG